MNPKKPKEKYFKFKKGDLVKAKNQFFYLVLSDICQSKNVRCKNIDRFFLRKHYHILEYRSQGIRYHFLSVQTKFYQESILISRADNKKHSNILVSNSEL